MLTHSSRSAKLLTAGAFALALAVTPAAGFLYSAPAAHAEGGVPASPFKDELAGAAKTLRQVYHVAYVQHAPLEPRAAVADASRARLSCPIAYPGWLGSAETSSSTRPGAT